MLYETTTVDTGNILGTIGIFLSGAGSVLTGYLAIRWEKKRGKQECDDRFQALHEGLKLRDEIDAQ